MSICIVINLVAAGALQAQAVNLTEARDTCVRNEMTMALEGKITVNENGKQVVYPHKARATHVYLERFIDINGAVSDKAARVYTTAESSITFNNDAPQKRTLRPDRASLMVAQRHKDHVVSYSIHGMLTREEMELTEHFDTQSIPGLLPGKQIAVGQTWPIAPNVVAALCDFDGLVLNKLEGQLKAVKGNIAHISIVGNAEGINLGAQVKVLVNAQLQFDINAQRIVALEWEETDARQQGPIGPAMSADVVVKLKRTPIAVPEALSNNALVKVPNGPPPSDLTALHHKHPRYTLNYGREWYVTSPDDSPQLVLRYLERGQFVAQATVSTPWKKTPLDKVMPIGAFAAEMRAIPGWSETRQLEENDMLPKGPKSQHTVYRVGAEGDLNGVKTTQFFYLIVGANGEQVVVTFSVGPSQVQQLGQRDLDMIRAIEFPEAPK
jgi:hypothetical protein